ncbi:MAG: T9SS type A sorting domain-containing protein, partial [Ginsengibacter sp.]
DWYKITTTKDGRLDLNLTTENGNYINIYLYDANGTTLISEKNTISPSGTLSTDGLAAGIYYVKIACYYNYQFTPYTLINNLVPPAQANDLEPNNSTVTALNLSENATVTGHVGYYNNNYRDTADWYKITTSKDGRLDLKLTTENGNYINIYLYDANGTILISEKNTISPSGTLSTDGLAAGTYYVKIASYYNYQYSPYTLTSSLISPAQANDNEPNNSPQSAIPLSVNKTVTGHVGYYNNNKRDTSDYYKIMIPHDGQLDLTITTNNGSYLNMFLLDKDGKTIINSRTTISPGYKLVTDGLAAGTYYVKVACYYNSEFSPYTLTDSLKLYQYSADTLAEPNKFPYEAKTLLSNRETTGHVGFYQDLKRDTTDWWKINYTGSGDLKITLKFEPNINNNSIPYYNYAIYKDTAGSPIASKNTQTSPLAIINLTNLSQQYYYIKINGYYNYDFFAYAISDSFTQVNIAKIAVLTEIQSNECNKNSLSYTLSKSHSPYKVRLYRDGKIYDSTTTTAATVDFSNLPDGVYYATVYGDGATDEAFSKSDNTTFLPPTPTSLTTSNIGVHTAKLNWVAPTCMKDFRIQYKKTGSATWTTLNTPTNNPGNYNLTSLAPYTEYTWQVASVNPVNSLVSNYSDTATFKTLSDTAKIEVASVIRGKDCNSNSIKYNVSNSEAPYTVQLYRYGKAYGASVAVTANTTFSLLPQGVYYATATGTGSGGSLGKSDTVQLTPPVPQGLTTTNIGFTAATLNWNALTCVSDYSLQFRLSGNQSWTTRGIKNNTQHKYELTNLIGDTTYIWRIASVDSSGELMSSYSDTAQFFTKSGLPVTLISFNAQYQPVQKNVFLTWKTATEQNNKGFEILRSLDGINFIQVGFVDGNGNSSSIISYSFTDTEPMSGQSFYRLKQVDMDGKSSLSPIVPVVINSNLVISFSPNPVKSQITVRSSSIVEMITLFNLQGQQIKQWKDVSPGKILDVSSITPGVYFIKAIVIGEIHTIKIVKE